MNVCYVANGIDLKNKKDGGDVHVYNVLVNLKRFCDNVYFVNSLFRPSLNILREYGIEEIKVYECFQLIGFGRFMPGLYDLHTYFRLRSLVKDIDVFHQRYYPAGISVSKMSREYKIPFVLELPTIRTSELEMLGMRKAKKHAEKYEEFIFNSAHKILFLSEKIREYVLSKGVDDEKVEITHVGVDTNRFNPDVDGSAIRKRFDLTGPVVLFLGCYVPWQGVRDLPEIVRYTVGKNKEIKFLFVGDGPLRNEIETKIKVLGLENHVIFTGRVDYDDVPKCMAVSDVCISPLPKGYITFPIKIFEYMASGKPIIVTGEGEVNRILENRKNALLIKPEDLEGFADGIIECVQNKELSNKISENALKEVRERYTWNAKARRLIEIYSDLIARVR